MGKVFLAANYVGASGYFLRQQNSKIPATCRSFISRIPASMKR